MELAWKEQVIQELIAEGNDEQVVRMVNTLLDLEPMQAKARIDVQMRLGRRCLVLALSQDVHDPNEAVETLLERQLAQPLSLQAAGSRHPMVLEWYAEAERLFSAVYEHATLPQVKSAALAHRGFVHALRGAYTLALAQLELAQFFLPQSAGLSYWHDLILVAQGKHEAASVALHGACEQDPKNVRYRQAYTRVLGRGDEVA